LVNLELHGIDMLDKDDGLDSLVAYQPDIRIPLRRKVLALTEAIGVLRHAGYRFVRLGEAAAELRDIA
jgi:hypothetical protein